MYKKNKQIHFVGIGGIGMSGIAELLLNLGYQVSGSDLNDTAITRRLKELGGKVFKGHASGSIEGADVVVTSTAVTPDNPEVVAAREAGIPVIRRAEMLAELMRLKKFGIGVAGSHGKTSTTSFIGDILAEAGLDPTVVIGGKVNSLGSNAKLGEGEFLVAEADESDGSFLHLSPVVEVITNIDLEHLDYYAGIEEIKAVFLEFINKIPFYGAVILCLDDRNITDLLPQIEKRVITYGLTAQADINTRKVKKEGFGVRFNVYNGGNILGEVSLKFPGMHNVYNALAAVAVGLELEIDFEIIARALSNFSGVQRRLQLKGEEQGVTVIDDYGHHPTEIKATLSALRDAWPNRRLVVMFQPHRYTRTKALFSEFTTAFYDADVLILTDIYPASEEPIEGITSEKLIEAIKARGQRKVYLAESVAALPDAVWPHLEEDDVVVSLGAGNIYQAGEQLLDLLREE